MARSIAIVGAGAKAAAIVARAAVLRELGAMNVPTIFVFEKDHIGAAWTGGARFSSGFLTLCTQAEKDVGFPYIEVGSFWSKSAPIGPALFAKFSWASFLIQRGQYADWLDRGRDHPTHRMWAAYLEWVFAEASQKVELSKVTSIKRLGDKWQIHSESNGAASLTLVDGVVLTGSGSPKQIVTSPLVPSDRVYDAETFWAARHCILPPNTSNVAVAGSGGSAGAIVAWLADRFAEQPVGIISVSSMGTLFPRGDGHAERRWFSNEGKEWGELSLEHRKNIIGRTEAGVISMRNKITIDQCEDILYARGRLVEIEWDAIESELILSLDYEGAVSKAHRASYIVNAVGFDPWSTLELIDEPEVSGIAARDRRFHESLELTMEDNLSLPLTNYPGIHFPAVCALKHGPGISNLGCLGIMAAKILDPYVQN